MPTPSFPMFESDSDKNLKFARPKDLGVRQLITQNHGPSRKSSKRWPHFVVWILAVLITVWWIDMTVTPDHSIFGDLFR
ncbi:MAG: hypothetical protein AAF438_06220 [Pseudomonadota bacterium]